MEVIKRNGYKQTVFFDKITSRIQSLCREIGTPTTWLDVDPIIVSQKICNQIHDQIHTKDIDLLASQTAVSMITSHPDYGTLAARIFVSNLHKDTNNSFLQTMLTLHEKDLVSDELIGVTRTHEEKISKALNENKNNDYNNMDPRVYWCHAQVGEKIEKNNKLQ